MTQTLLFSAAVLVAVAGLGLSQDKSPPRTPAKLDPSHAAQTSTPTAKVKPAADFPVVGYIEKRDRTITIKAGPKGPVYSVKTADGKVLCENLSKEQLSAQAPELGEFIKTAVAGVSGTKADARVRVKVDASMR
jgi:predicted lipoprotein